LTLVKAVDQDDGKEVSKKMTFEPTTQRYQFYLAWGEHVYAHSVEAANFTEAIATALAAGMPNALDVCLVQFTIRREDGTYHYPLPALTDYLMKTPNAARGETLYNVLKTAQQEQKGLKAQ